MILNLMDSWKGVFMCFLSSVPFEDQETSSLSTMVTMANLWWQMGEVVWVKVSDRTELLALHIVEVTTHSPVFWHFSNGIATSLDVPPSKFSRSFVDQNNRARERNKR